MAEYTCPTCNANSFDPCVTASGKPAKKRHAAFEKMLNEMGFEEVPADEIAADVVVKNPKMLADAVRNTESLNSERETQKERFDRLKAENRAPKPVPLKVPTRASKRKGTSQRQYRRDQGNYKSVGKGARNRRRRADLNLQVRAFWAPKPTEDVNAVA